MAGGGMVMTEQGGARAGFFGILATGSGGVHLAAWVAV